MRANGIEKPAPKQYGALLIFKPGTAKADAEAAIARLVAEGLIDRQYHPAGQAVQAFDPRYGGPVWYVP